MIGKFFRNVFTTGLFVLFVLFTYLDFGISPETMIVLIFSLLTPLWELAGYFALMALGFFLVYRSIGGFVGLFTLIFGIQYVESVYLTLRNAPPEHYYVLFAGTLLAIPVYYFAYLLSLYVPSLVNTAVASVFIVLLYVLFYIIVRR
ncbi:hypothetical protein [Thermococcus sp.]|uniref:hypothetical protein n=1 Tax=Thermococcus sp. TaxID=35749 RepID=UPI00261FFBD1|nr:hypothetical protein [Thermococcus sp.]